MGQFTPSYQPSFNNYTQNDGFSGGGETPLGSGDPQTPPSTSGFNGASLVQSNGNPLGGVYSQPGRFGNPAAPPPAQNQSSFGNPGWKPSYNAPGGYNPLQYASDTTANELAQGLGGTVERTKTVGPFGDFGQNQIRFGNGNQLNAGLVADRYSKYDAATANAMTEAEKNAGPAVTNPNAGAVYLTGNPMINPSQTPGYHPPGTPAAPTPTNPLIGGPGSEPQVTGPQPGAMTQQAGGGQQNQLMQLLQLLGMGGQARPQNRQPYANSGYYPNLPRFNQGLLTPGQGQASIKPMNSPSSGPAGINPLSSDWRATPEQIALNAYVQSRGPNPYQPAGYDPRAMQSQEVKPWQQKWNDELKQDPEYMRLYNAATPQNGMLPYQRPSVNTTPAQAQGLPSQNVQQQLLSLLLGF